LAYEVRWDEKAREFLRAIKLEDAQRIIKKVNSIIDFPEHYLEELTEVKAYKLRVGDYRVILDLDETRRIISVLFIGHRKNVYDKL
jgi:mRNA interferase RelE/StbE